MECSSARSRSERSPASQDNGAGWPSSRAAPQSQLKRSTTTEATMSNAHDNQQSAETATPDTVPAVVERATFQTQLDALRVEEKAHTRAGDAIAAARRRLPIAGVDAATPLIGPHGPVTLLE